MKYLEESNRIVARYLHLVEHTLLPGMTTLQLNKMAEDIAYSHGAVPAFKGYRGFPFAICASVNQQVVHGFPNDTPLKEGDIVSIDFGILKDGFHGDAARTYMVGEVPNNIRRLVKITELALQEGIKKAQPGNRIGDISCAIQGLVEESGYNVVKEFAGHGIGKDLHEKPQILNYGRENRGKIIKPGMALSIEPIVTEGKADIRRDSDGWTIYTRDGSLAAHFEHTIYITTDGNKILSKLGG